MLNSLSENHISVNITVNTSVCICTCVGITINVIAGETAITTMPYPALKS